MVKSCFQISFTNGFCYHREKLNGVLNYLRYEIPNLAEEDLLDLRIIYNELITNAIVHAHKLDYTKNVDMFIEISDKSIETTIKDEGVGFDYITISDSTLPYNDAFREHGRGLRLVMDLADRVEWNDAGNVIMISKDYRTE